MHASSGHRHQVISVLVPLELLRNLSEEAEEGGVQMIKLLIPVGAVDRSARIQNILQSSEDLRNILRDLARRSPEIHLEGERVRQSLSGEPFQGRVRDDAAIPIVFAVDFDRGKPRRQRAARHYMLGPDGVRRGVEIDQLTTSRIDTAEAETDVVAFRVDEVEIYEALERRLERRRIVKARRLDRARRLKQNTWNPRRVKAGHADYGSGDDAHLLGKGARGIASCQQGAEVAAETEGRAADELPELAQLGHAPLSRIAGDDRGIDSAYRGAGDTIRPEVGLGQCFVDTCLVGPESAATLQQKRDAAEGRPMLQLVRLSQAGRRPGHGAS